VKRLTVLLLIVLALPLMAAERWWEAYNRGVKAVNAKQYAVAVQAFEAAIAAAPAESSAARVRNTAMVYVPHYWLGVAKFNLGDVEGAVRAWRISEEQGAIAKTELYPKLREWISRAQAEKKRDAADAASSSKKTADKAVSAAMVAQVAALSAGADRTDTYRAAEAKLREAMTQFRGAGTDVASFERASQTAGKARELFTKAADDAKKLKATRQQQIASRPAPPPASARQPASVAAQSAVAEPEPVVTATVASSVEPPPASVAGSASPLNVTPVSPPPVQEVIAVAEPVTQPVQTPQLSAPADTGKPGLRAQLESAYRFYASGNLDASERALTTILSGTRSGEALLLRGCARYTRAMLSREPQQGLETASSDFKAALKLNRSLRLDKRAFSPKLVEFFESVRKSG
jgi:tetratricopeptide (TPR) repeat protein